VVFENTVSEHEFDAESRELINRLSTVGPERSPDLDVDGLSDSVLARVKRFLSFGRD
jgi:hypothetical protein